MNTGDDIKIESRGGRWYADTQDGFDGTAQGYGYKTKQSLLKARWFFLNKARLQAEQSRAKAWLQANPEAKSKIDEFTGDLDYWLDDAKDGGSGPSLKRFLEEYRDDHGSAPWFQEIEQDMALGKAVWRLASLLNLWEPFSERRRLGNKHILRSNHVAKPLDNNFTGRPDGLTWGSRVQP